MDKIPKWMEELAEEFPNRIEAVNKSIDSVNDSADRCEIFQTLEHIIEIYKEADKLVDWSLDDVPGIDRPPYYKKFKDFIQDIKRDTAIKLIKCKKVM